MNASEVADFLKRVVERHPAEPEFHQAVAEVVRSVAPFVAENPHYRKARILDRMVEPERVITFRVTWMDRHGEVQVNRGHRVQMNSAIGPFKGGLRFHPSVTLGMLKFLAFEQTFKNSLTTLPMGGGKGGADFDPKGRTDEEVMRFCQAFMNELWRHIGPDTDVPAGDMGVGGREIGFLFGQYKKLRNDFGGVLTGKGINWGGSRIRTEATGYGLVYFVEEMFHHVGDTLTGKVVSVSGSGNVAQYAAEKAMLMGAKVVTFSDSDGFVHDPAGVDAEKLAFVKELKDRKRGRIKEYADKFKCDFHAKKNPWGVKCDVALPCATQNEIAGDDALALVKNGCKCVAEGANMPSTAEAVHVFIEKKILFGPGKAANAGGVAVSGLEMSQDSLRLSWSREEVEKRLSEIMTAIHRQCVHHGEKKGFVNYVDGANIAGFRKVAEAMLDQGLV
ncbi:MAG: NADP-specific glutamate dehydrogenase [Verrucomicrobiia bacterium]